MLVPSTFDSEKHEDRNLSSSLHLFVIKIITMTPKTTTSTIITLVTLLELSLFPLLELFVIRGIKIDLKNKL